VIEIVAAAPITFAEALQQDAAKRLLPTDLRTRLLREIPSAIRSRTRFSAGVTHTGFLAEVDDLVAEGLKGELDQGSIRKALREYLDTIGYVAEAGEEGTIYDLRSFERLDKIVDTNIATTQGWAYDQQGQDPDLLDQWPAYELVRAGSPEAPRNWQQRWTSVGGTLRQGRMVALKNDPIWEALGREFDDGLNNPFPPFAWGSTMDWEEIEREEAERLGLLDVDAPAPTPRKVDLNEDLEAAPERVDPRSALGRALEASLDGLAAWDDAGVLRFTGGAR
jgi:hypothetical protein